MGRELKKDLRVSQDLKQQKVVVKEKTKMPAHPPHPPPKQRVNSKPLRWQHSMLGRDRPETMLVYKEKRRVSVGKIELVRLPPSHQVTLTQGPADLIRWNVAQAPSILKILL